MLALHRGGNLRAWVAAVVVCVLLTVSVCAQSVSGDTDEKLATDFWAWRARYGQFTTDDINRMERPTGVVRDWSAAAVEKQRKELAEFSERWKKLDDRKAPVVRQVDHRLMGSALARVHWELDILKRWQSDPMFYLDQTLTPVAEALTVPGPYDEAQSREILARLNNIPAIAGQAPTNLVSPSAELASMAIGSLDGVKSKLQRMAKALAPETKIPTEELRASAERAGDALERYRAWLQGRLAGLPAQSAIGRENYVWFLRNVALMPYTPEELVSQAEQEWHRAVAFEGMEANRNRSVPPLEMAPTIEEFVGRNQNAELASREFLERRNIRTLPAGLRHYTLRAFPEYLRALGDFVETDDFTSASRLDKDAIRYANPPSLKQGYFWIADAKDPRVSIVHEGTIGHYGQLCASWQHPDEIRRHYYDSGANEGIGFYAEEMMLQSGLYDDSPHSREIVYNQMLLRALRVIADVKVSLGELTLTQAADFLERNVPMSAASAHQEVVEMGAWPGQKISYQTGKLQIVQMLSDARLKEGDKFSLRKFHDYVWLNGNVPIALQRWELLGIDDDMKKVDGSR